MSRFGSMRLVHFLLFTSLLWHSAAGSCCCCDCCCCCCPCCCCCGCGSNNNNNALNNLALGTSTATTTTDDDLTLGAQPANSENTAGLGPGLLPDGSTGRTNQQSNNQFGGQFGGRKRRKRGLGKLDHQFAFGCGCRNRRIAVAMPNGGSKPKQKPVLPSDWTMSIGGNQPSLGPGLLPDGSTERPRHRPTHNEFGFGDFFGNEGGMSRRRRRGRLERAEEWPCQCGGKGGEGGCGCSTKFQLGLVPLEEMQHKNQTFLRFLLGLVPEDQASSQPVNGQQEGGDNRKWKRTGEFQTIRRQFFLVPVTARGPGKNRAERPDGGAGENVQTVLPKPPLQFYKPVEPIPENDRERYEADYD